MTEHVVSDSEAEARRAYDGAKRQRDQLKQAIEHDTPRVDQLKMLDHLWRHINDFIPRHWREE